MSKADKPAYRLKLHCAKTIDKPIRFNDAPAALAGVPESYGVACQWFTEHGSLVVNMHHDTHRIPRINMYGQDSAGRTIHGEVSFKLEEGLLIPTPRHAPNPPDTYTISPKPGIDAETIEAAKRLLGLVKV